MADTSMQMPGDELGGEDSTIKTGDELPVKLDTLLVGGERPAVGDHVEVTVAGSVSRIVDDCCYVTVETANDQEIHKAKGDEEEYGEGDLAAASRQMDMMGAPIGGGGGYQ